METTGKWLTQTADYGASITPINDVIHHDNTGENADEDCVCGPTWNPAEDEHSLSWVLVHHSLDGRENHERP